LIGTIKDFNIPSEDLAKTMLGGVKLADYADNRVRSSARAGAEFRLCNNILGKMARGNVPRGTRIIKRTRSDPEDERGSPLC
jgi:hypothetical protein